MKELNLEIAGMSCGHCVATVSTALKGIEGVSVNNVAVGSASVSYEPSITTPERIRDAIEDAGYKAKVQ